MCVNICVIYIGYIERERDSVSVSTLSSTFQMNEFNETNSSVNFNAI